MLQAGRVLDVMQAGEKRVVLVTDKDVALLRMRIVSLRSTYRPMWFVRLSSIQTVRGGRSPDRPSRVLNT